MFSNAYRKILIIGQPFNVTSGGGITLTNLFTGWPIDKIAVAFAPWGEVGITTQICNTYYRIGNEEHKWRFPFNIFKRSFPISGLITDVVNVEKSYGHYRKGLKRFLADIMLNPLLTWMGLFHYGSEIKISEKMKDWLKMYKPDILYLQVSTLEGIVFSCQLIDHLRIPSAIHMMDDWPSTISMSGPLKNFWRNKIDKEFRILLDKVNLHLSISESMSEEYKNRYGKEFIAFHNPIQPHAWLFHRKTSFALNKEHITILFSGRIGTGISHSLIEVASAIDALDYNNFSIKFHIQTTNKENDICHRLQRFKCVVINPTVDYKEIPEIFSNADILVLANDFNSEAINFLKFSMPTKAPEYMISGTPVLVYAPQETAVSKFFSLNNCGFCVTSQGQEALMNAIHYMLNNEEYRRQISENAINLAQGRFNADTVREKFHSTLLNQKILR
jgi:glycosyltransferase involved in cell wall biosynthesis